MRPALAALVIILLVGGAVAYSSFIEHVRQLPAELIETSAKGSYDLEVTCTFDCAGDDFGQPAVLVKFRDLVLLEQTKPVVAGQSIRIRNIQQIKVGMNDIFVLANPSAVSSTSKNNDPFSLDTSDNNTTPEFSAEPSQAFGPARAVHIRVFSDIHVVAEKTLWSDTAGPISDLIKLQVRQ